MTDRAYKASLSQSQGREGWAIIFRHPVRIERTTGKPGLRVRRGLGTKNRTEAEQLVAEMNELLNEPSFWDISAKANAQRRFQGRIVDIFYHEIVPEPADYFLIRDSVIRLPALGSNYRRVLLVGTTGGGKTTLVRQLIVTNPQEERFPSTSAGKTTVADMELLFDDSPYRAVVTFMPLEEVRDYVEESMSAAALASFQGEPDSEVLRRLLNHVNQRFRLSHILGQGPRSEEVRDLEFDDDDEQISECSEIDLTQTNQLLSDAVRRLREVAAAHGKRIWSELGAEAGDERVVQEIFEEELDRFLREDDDFQDLADDLIEEVEARFDRLNPQNLQKTKQGWPRLWSWETDDRSAFLREIARFSSNHAAYFGSLLSPLVNGIRVAGPFQPIWSSTQPKLVLFDGEGLGHTPDSSASIPTSLTRRFENVDVILLIDNAAQPMQAAPVQLMRSLASSGKTAKMLTCFTHMDLVQGDNLPTFQDKKNHVLSSAENVLTSIGEQLGPFAERALRQSLQRGRFFVGDIDQRLDSGKRGMRRTIDQLLSLLTAINAVGVPPVISGHIPVYDKYYLVLRVKNAAQQFQDEWMMKLEGRSKEHWARVKALSRRLAEGWSDQYDSLMPVADLRRHLQNDIYLFIQNPLKWEGRDPSDDDKQKTFDVFAEGISARVLDLATRRLRQEHVSDWQNAYNRRGTGSTYRRAEIIKDDIYNRAAPVPDVAQTPDRNKFLHEVIALVEDTAKELDVKLV
jgi:hypothetical protein